MQVWPSDIEKDTGAIPDGASGVCGLAVTIDDMNGYLRDAGGSDIMRQTTEDYLRGEAAVNSKEFDGNVPDLYFAAKSTEARAGRYAQGISGGAEIKINEGTIFNTKEDYEETPLTQDEVRAKMDADTDEYGSYADQQGYTKDFSDLCILHGGDDIESPVYYYTEHIEGHDEDDPTMFDRYVFYIGLFKGTKMIKVEIHDNNDFGEPTGLDWEKVNTILSHIHVKETEGGV